MAQENFVAFFASTAEAEAARRDLEAAGIPSVDITVTPRPPGGAMSYATAATAEATASAPHGAGGIFDWFFANEPPVDALNQNPPHLDDSIGAVLSLTADGQAAARIAEILARYGLAPVPRDDAPAGSFGNGT